MSRASSTLWPSGATIWTQLSPVNRSDSAGAGKPVALTEKAFASVAVAAIGPGFAPNAGAAGAGSAVVAETISDHSPPVFRART